MKVVVVGAGAFGGWTALQLVRRGARVELIDAWGPGHARSSSGGETRVIRATYGSRGIYTRMAVRALELWRDHERRFDAGLLRPGGALWLFPESDPFRDASQRAMADAGVRLEEIPPPEAARRYPQIDFAGVAGVWLEPDAGYLFARQACAHVAECVAAEGGVLRIAAAASPAIVDDRSLVLADGSRVEADAFVFACGPWLASLFPDVLGRHLAATRQDVYYFGGPAGDARFSEPHLPVWLEAGERFFYGIPGAPGRGFKIADDTPGPVIDPTVEERTPDPDGVARARAYLARRFPALAGAPLIRSEVCQYESTPDAHFVVDRHPALPHVWLVGGGSGHGFKMGPALGEVVAAAVLDGTVPDRQLSVARFAAPPPGGWPKKWS